MLVVENNGFPNCPTKIDFSHGNFDFFAYYFLKIVKFYQILELLKVIQIDIPDQQ